MSSLEFLDAKWVHKLRLKPLESRNSLYLFYSCILFNQIFRVVKGRGDVFDTSGRLASIKGAALNVPAAGTSEGTVNLSQENEDLKVSLSVRGPVVR